jgi:hypothetical protein
VYLFNLFVSQTSFKWAIKTFLAFYISGIIITIIVIIIALQPFVWPWPLFQFLDPIRSR